MAKIRKKGNRQVAITEIHPELMKIFEDIKEDISKTTWEAVKTSDYEASLIVARKYRDANLSPQS